MCYTRRSITEGVISNEYGCLEHLDPGHFPSHFLDQVCLISNPTNVYHCCNDTNYCNNVTLVFPVAETVLPTPSVLSTSASSEWKGEEREGGGGRRDGVRGSEQEEEEGEDREEWGMEGGG